MNNKRQSNRDAPHSIAIRYVSIAEGERDSAFLHNNGTNSWPLVQRSSSEIADALEKFHSRFLPKAIDF